MCELQVMAGSRDSADPYKDPRLFKSGDVLVARENGWEWGREDLSNPLFIIIRAPDLSTEEGAALCVEEPGDLQSNPMLLIRSFSIDLNKVSSASGIDGVARHSAYIDSTGDEIRSAVYQKESPTNPMVVG